MLHHGMPQPVLFEIGEIEVPNLKHFLRRCIIDGVPIKEEKNEAEDPHEV
jgi:hypothetical protein